MEDIHYDLCIIGGGINGAGIARDAAGRGLSVLLVEAQDLAGATSSASTKLIHGGLRYLENREFSLVRKSLKEREILYRNAQHLIWPIECVLPFDAQRRPKWLLRMGLWLYDHLGGAKTLPNSTIVNFADDPTGRVLQESIKNGFKYADCQTDDTRLVIMNAVDAAARGAKILTYTQCDKLEIHEGRWRVGLKDTRGGDDSINISASMVVNATGPWVGSFLDSIGLEGTDPDLPTVRLVKGSHIILPRQYEGDHAYVLQQPDGRIVFVAPYEGQYTLVGTTEEEYEGDPRDARISDAEMAYLCDAYNAGFKQSVARSDVIFTYSGVRPLLDDGNASASRVTREHFIYHHKRYEAPFLSLYGGKLTAYRSVSEEIVDQLMRLSGRMNKGWTEREPLVGGDIGDAGFSGFIARQKQQYPWLPDDLLHRYARSYGTRMDYFLHGVEALDGLGAHYGDHVYKAEIDYLRTYEWALSAQDVIWRRSKFALHFSDETLANIEAAFSPSE
tara:strand:+ start:212 stop:1720 length:1509 start_codon:yes stop_codon:yes gene_type:complete